MRHEGFPDGLGITDEGMSHWWEKHQQWTATHLIVEALDGTPLGESGWGFSGVPGELEMKLARPHWSQGFASDAFGALLDAIFGHTTIDNVIVTPRPENEAAQRLYRRFCFRPSLPPPGLSPGECEYWTLARANTRSPSTLIFDWGGVLMRTMDDDGRRSWETRLGLPAGGANQAVFGSAAWRDTQLGRCTAEQCWSAIGESLELTPVALTQFRRDFWAGDQLNQPLIERIHEWKTAGYRVALLSNFPAELDDLLCAHDLRELFDPAIISAHEGVMKPASRIFWRTLSRMGISPADALLVDDAAENVAGARNVGLHAIQFCTTRQAVKEIEELLP